MWLQLAETVFREVKLTRQPLKDVPGVHIPADAVGIALIPQPRKPGEAISAFESEAVQQSTAELLAVVRSAALHCLYLLIPCTAKPALLLTSIISCSSFGAFCCRASCCGAFCLYLLIPCILHSASHGLHLHIHCTAKPVFLLESTKPGLLISSFFAPASQSS